LDPNDLVQEGALRFFNSTLKNFDPDLGSLEKYLQNWVRTAMWRSVGSKLGIFKIGPDMAADIIRVDRFCAEFNVKHSKDPTDQEIADGLALELSRVKSVFKAKSAQIASPILADGEELDRFDFISGKSGTPESLYSDLEEASARSDLLGNLLGTLDPQVRSLVERNLGLNGCAPVSVRSLGSEMGVSHEAVAKRIRNAMKKLEEEAKKYEGEIPF
jgi:RNA polymerase primary sigma factor